MTLQGIPCIYYGAEQGLDGNGDRREYVREALWGKPNAFSADHELYRMIGNLSALRDQEPALRYGRQYFRPCSPNGLDFGYSPDCGGVICFSRILNDREVVIVANTGTLSRIEVHVVVDSNLNSNSRPWRVLFSTRRQPTAPEITRTHDVYRTVRVALEPMEAQVMG